MEIDMTNARSLPHVFVPDNVENEAAYIAAAQARIMANRAKGAHARWIAESGEEVVTLCCDFLCENGEFAPAEVRDADGWTVLHVTHPLVKASLGEFFGKMFESLRDWGRLTAGQEKAVIGMIERAKQRVADREVAKQAKRDSARHVGTVGERRDFALSIKFVTSFETQFGTTFVHVMEDADANVVVYKGSKLLGEKGTDIELKATIKEHGMRDGVAQTIITRPKQM
jgi:hypothetical protein